MRVVLLLLLVAVANAATLLVPVAPGGGNFGSSTTLSGKAYSDLPLCSSCPKQPLDPQQKLDLQNANKDLAKRLAPDAVPAVHRFVVALEDKYNTFLKLANPIKNGHSIRFTFVQGDQSAVARAAQEEKVVLKGDSIEVPEAPLYTPPAPPSPALEARAAEARNRWQNARKPGEAAAPIPERANKFIGPDSVPTLLASNRAVAQNLHPNAFEVVQKFLAALDRSHNYIRLYGAIKGGHVVDYELLNGSRSDVKKVAAQFNIDVSDQALTVKVSDEILKPNYCGQGNACPKPGDVIIVPAPGQSLRSNAPNTMILSVQQEPVKIIN